MNTDNYYFERLIFVTHLQIFLHLDLFWLLLPLRMVMLNI